MQLDAQDHILDHFEARRYRRDEVGKRRAESRRVSGWREDFNHRGHRVHRDGRDVAALCAR